MSLLPVGISGEEAGYQIERSLRFNSSDSAYLNFTPASAGNRKTWTWSGWIKLSSTSNGYIFGVVNSNDSDTAAIAYTGNQFSFQGYTVNYRDTTALYRDFSAWYHLVVALDTTQATAANRVKMYVNGVEVTSFATTNNPSQNADLGINTATEHSIGRRYPFGGGGVYFNGYLTEINFIDGSALDPTSFGEFNSDTGVWQPKAYTGSYGTNGFYLNFSDNSGVTSTTLGADSSGNGNNWTPNNFSVTAGAGNDSLVDSPTNYGVDTGAGGEVRGNYATLNPLSRWAGGGSVVLSEGNLKAAFTNQYANHGTIAVSSGKYYWEAVVTSATINSTGGGIMTVGQAGSNTSPYLGWVLDVQAGRNYYNNSFTTLTGGSFASGDRLGVAVDMDNGKIWYAKNGTWLGTSADPAAGTGAAQTNVSGEVVPVFFEANSGFSATWEANFGQRPFAYTAPSGFKALCTQNLPEPTIVDGGEYFNTVLYTGNGATGQTITGVGFQPDFVWVKSRSSAYDHGLQDVLRGVTKDLNSNDTQAEETRASSITAFTSDGFTLGGNDLIYNASGGSMVAWNWKANGAGVSNTAGTITSTVSVNTTSGFSIITYTGNGTSGATIGHGLGVAPVMTIIKRRSSTETWVVWHTAFNSAQSNVRLEQTSAVDTASPAMFNNTFPSSTLITLGNGGFVNTSAQTYVCYAFAAVAGYSAFGSYTGNGSADGPFVYTNFRPAFVLVKGSSFASNWNLFDATRNPSNITTQILRPNLSNTEFDGNVNTGGAIDIVSNGFKIRKSDADVNTSSATFIYMAFAENPFRYSLAR